MASVTSINVEENDLIVIATDGLWDNLPDSTIIEETKKMTVSYSTRTRCPSNMKKCDALKNNLNVHLTLRKEKSLTVKFFI